MTCPECNGRGHRPTATGGAITCYLCRGAGQVGVADEFTHRTEDPLRRLLAIAEQEKAQVLLSHSGDDWLVLLTSNHPALEVHVDVDVAVERILRKIEDA